MIQSAVVVLALLTSVADAAPDGIVPVQGMLSDVDGNPIDEALPVTFKLYGSQSEASALWNETQTVTFDNGAFTVYLGAAAPLDLATFRDNQGLWLGITIDDDEEMDRFAVASVPYAGYAAFAGEAESLNGLTDVDFMAADYDIAAVCYDTPEELKTALAGEYLDSTYAPDWDAIKNQPTGLDDGDDDTKYTAGAGLTLSSGNQFAVDSAAIGTIAQGVCYDTESEVRAVLDDNYFDAETDLTKLLDDNYTYKAGPGLTLATGNQFTVDAAWLLGQNPPWAGDNLVDNTALWSDPLERVPTLDPIGAMAGAHKSVEVGTNCYNWAQSQRFAVDPTTSYEFSTWLKSEGLDLSNYVGFTAFDASGNQIGGAYANPYFKAAKNDPNTWVRWSGHMLPTGTADANGDGLADTQATGTNGADWVWPASTATAVIRLGSCYGDGVGGQAAWYAHPMVRALDLAGPAATVAGPDPVALQGAGPRGANLATVTPYADPVDVGVTTLPQGSTGAVHRSAENGTSCYEWGVGGRFPVNPTANYEFSIWIRSTELDLNNYLGFYLYDAAGAQIGGAWANPYFKTEESDPNTWVKWTGLLASSGSTDANGDGVLDTQSAGTTGLDWKMPSNAAYGAIRYGACYGNGSNSGQSFFAYPEVHEINPSNAWVVPAFQGAWANYGSGYNPVGYMKDEAGIVHLRGLVQGGAIGGNVFTLPPGFRPAYRELHVVQSNSAAGRIDVLPDGSVTTVNGSSLWISLDGITFRATN